MTQGELITNLMAVPTPTSFTSGSNSVKQVFDWLSSDEVTAFAGGLFGAALYLSDHNINHVLEHPYTSSVVGGVNVMGNATLAVCVNNWMILQKYRWMLPLTLVGSTIYLAAKMMKH